MKENFFTLYPAIDIKDGKCVRLIRGDFNQMNSYDKSPFDIEWSSNAFISIKILFTNLMRFY